MIQIIFYFIDNTRDNTQFLLHLNSPLEWSTLNKVAKNHLQFVRFEATDLHGVSRSQVSCWIFQVSFTSSYDWMSFQNNSCASEWSLLLFLILLYSKQQFKLKTNPNLCLIYEKTVTEDLEANIKRKFDDNKYYCFPKNNIKKYCIFRYLRLEFVLFYIMCFILITDYCVIKTFLKKGHQSVLYKDYQK